MLLEEDLLIVQKVVPLIAVIVLLEVGDVALLHACKLLVGNQGLVQVREVHPVLIELTVTLGPERCLAPSLLTFPTVAIVSITPPVVLSLVRPTIVVIVLVVASGVAAVS